VTPITDGVAPVTTRADPALVKALARAFRYQRLLDEGRYVSMLRSISSKVLAENSPLVLEATSRR
jgi:hypothetical protein